MKSDTQGMVPFTNSMAVLLAAKFKQGIHMGTGTVYPDQTACKCGGKWANTKFGKLKAFVCDVCGEEPTLFRVRRGLPTIDGGKSKPQSIRKDQYGKRIRTLHQAYAMNDYIQELMDTGKFDPEMFAKPDHNSSNYENFLIKTYLPFCYAKVKTTKLKPSSMVAKHQYMCNYLLPLFTGFTWEKKLHVNDQGVEVATFTKTTETVDWALKVRSIKDIHDGTIELMYATLPGSTRMKDIVAEELRAQLNFAHRQRLIDKQVFFPKMAKPKLKDPETFLSQQDQQKILENIPNVQYRAMLAIMCLIAIRPSEVRALKWSDWDFKAGKLWIRRHVTCKSIVIPGRKSRDDVHSIALSKELMNTIEILPRPIKQEIYMFPGDRKEIVTEHCLSRAWKKAMKKAGLKHVDSYRGSKSSCMSNWLRAGYSVSMISAFTGLTEEDVRRYAQQNNQGIHDIQIQMQGG